MHMRVTRLPLPECVRELLQDEDRASTVLIGSCGIVGGLAFLGAIAAILLLR